MEVIPSIDLKEGRCVRLYQGDFSQETVYSQDPLGVARGWQEQGAVRLHLVDLDGAASGNSANREITAAILQTLAIPVQVGGGVRDFETAETLLELGADRVVVGTAAVEKPELVEDLARRFGSERVVVALDARDGKVATRGWTQDTEVDVLELAHGMKERGATRLLYTDISRDGTLTQPNYQANEELVRNSGMAVQASGGIASLEHVELLRETGVEGVILGRALYTGKVRLADAIEAGRGQLGLEDLGESSR